MFNKKIKIKKIFLCSIALVLVLFANVLSPINAYAGTNATGGSGALGGGGKGGYWIDSRKNTTIWWEYAVGSIHVQTSIRAYHDSIHVDNIQKGAYVVVNNNGAPGPTYMPWKWFNSNVGAFCKPATPKKLSEWAWGKKVWGETWLSRNVGSFKDAEFINEASNNGYHYNENEWRYTNGSAPGSPHRELDGVWVSGHWVEADYSRQVITNSYWQKKVNGQWVYDKQNTENHSGWNAQDLWNENRQSATYSNQSDNGEYNHNRRLVVVYQNLNQHVRYWETGPGQQSQHSYTYSKSGSEFVKARDFSYNVQQPSLTQTWFKPFHLNVNGYASDSLVKQTYPGYRGNGIGLIGSVDNGQSITDGSNIKTLDTNTSTKFSIKINNEQLGIPNASQGGFDLWNSIPYQDYKIGNNSYNPNIFNVIPNNGETTTGKFKSESVSNNISGKISKDFYWGGAIKAGINSGNASITYNGDEKVGGNMFSFSLGWRGGDFVFKTTKIGIYKLTNNTNNVNWWEANYEQGKMFTYGVKYNGSISLSGIGAPSIGGSGMYCDMATGVKTQPILYGTIEAKTVAGDIH